RNYGDRIRLNSTHIDQVYYIRKVKEKEKIWGAVFLTIVYLLMVGMYSYRPDPDVFAAKKQNGKTTYFSLDSSTPFYHSPQPETAANYLDSPFILNLKIPFAVLKSMRIPSGGFAKTTFRQYGRLALNLCINRSIAVSLFPFHYFW